MGLLNEMGSGDRRSRFVEERNEQLCQVLEWQGGHPDGDDL